MNTQNDSNQIPLGTGNNSTLNKIPLAECRNFKTESYVKIFKVEKDIVEKNGGKVWLDMEHKTDYKKDEIVPTGKFHLYGQSHGAFGVRIEMTEQMLEDMLAYVREEKKKVYCFEGSQ